MARQLLLSKISLSLFGHRHQLAVRTDYAYWIHGSNYCLIFRIVHHEISDREKGMLPDDCKRGRVDLLVLAISHGSKGKGK